MLVTATISEKERENLPICVCRKGRSLEELERASEEGEKSNLHTRLEKDKSSNFGRGLRVGHFKSEP